MLTEVLKIQTRLDDLEANMLEKKLNTRFNRVAKGFGKALRIGAVLALGSAVLDKLINPLKEVKDAIDRTLSTADDVVTNAKQFGSTTENLLKVRALASTHGVSAENIDVLLTKFQGAIAQASLNPNDPANSAVKNYIGEKDTAQAFYNFIVQLQKMDSTQRTLIQQQVFGEKQMLKMAELLQDDNFAEAAKALEKVDFKASAKAAEKLAALNDKVDQNRTVNGLNDLQNKAKVITGSTINDLNNSEMKALSRQNGQLSRSAASFSAEENMQNIQENLEKLTQQILTNIPEIMTGLNKGVELLGTSVKGWESIFSWVRQVPSLRGVVQGYERVKGSKF